MMPLITRYRTVLFLLIIVGSAIFLFSLPQRFPHVDDAWLGEHAYWQDKLGYVRSDLMHGITHQDERFLCHHKLLTLQGALAIRLAGFSLPALKSVSLLYLVAFLVTFFFYVRSRGLPKLFYPVVLLLLIFNAHIGEFAYTFRPEIPVMTLGFLSFIFLEKSLKTKPAYALLSGMFAGLSFFTHLNGAAFPVAGFLLAALYRKPKVAVLFAMATVPGILAYFYDLTPAYDLNFLLYQLNETPSHSRLNSIPILSNLIGLVDEQMRFLHSPKEITFYLLFGFSLIAGWKYIKQEKVMLHFLWLLMFFIAFIAVHKTAKYAIVYFPYIVYLTALFLTKLADGRQYWPVFGRKLYLNPVNWAVVLLGVYLVTQTVFNFLLINRRYDAARTHRELSDRLLTSRPDTTTVIAPIQFVFNEIGKSKEIRASNALEELAKTDPSLRGANVLRYALREGIDFMVIENNIRSKMGLTDMSAGEVRYGGYKLTHEDGELAVYKRIR